MGEICGFRLGLCFGYFILIDEQVAFDALVIFLFLRKLMLRLLF
jgi:hypothetical protein